MIWIGLGIVGAVVLFFVLALVMTVDDWSRDLSTNEAETSSEATDPLLRPLLVKGTNAYCAAQVVQQQIDEMPRWKYEGADGSGGVLMSATRTTPLWGFVDDIRITIVGDAHDMTEIAVYSKSRLGKGDLGQNPRNIKELMQRLQALEESAWKCAEFGDGK